MQPDGPALAILRGDALPCPIVDADVGTWENADLDLLLADLLQAQGRAHLWPAGAESRRQARARAAAAAEAAEASRLREVLAALAAAGIEALLLKGIALAYTHYPKPWLRPRGDVDLLLPHAARDRVVEPLAALGFQPAVEVTDRALTAQRHFEGPGRLPLRLDVHATLVNPPLLRTLPTFDALRPRARAVPALGPHARALHPADALLHAAVHRVAHHNSSEDLLWLYDMHLLARSLEPPDWPHFVAAAEGAGVCAIAADGLRLIAAQLGTPVPPDVLVALERVRDEPSARLLGGRLTEWRLQWLNFSSLPDVRARARFVGAHLFPAPAVVPGARHVWLRPLAYGRRAVRGVVKWLRPIGRSR